MNEPTGPVADVSEELTGGSGLFLGSPDGFARPEGYIDQEFVASGTATAYEPAEPLTNDGRWTFEPSTSASYRTRILVRRPSRASDASGVVVLEWLNVSGGADANPEYFTLQEEIVRRRHTWVGVSAQLIGVEGGPVLVTTPTGEGVAGVGIKHLDPARYGTLDHPGDGYSFDIFSQVARAVGQGGSLLGGVTPEILIASGESQSAIALTTYYNGVQPLSRVFDGFYVHSRGGASLPLVGPGEFADLAGSIGSSVRPVFRDDLDAPVLDIQAEGDVAGLLNSSAARQPDNDGFRLWEVAGTAHADARLVGDLVNHVDCGVGVNDGPFHVVAKAALRGLETWLRTGAQPPTVPRLELVDSAAPQILRDGDGIGLGGIRTPPVDVPVDALSGDPGPSADVICLLLGSTTPLSDARLAELYSTRADYVQKYASATDRAIDAGFVLEEDRDAMLAYAQPSRIAP
ncbi:MAG: alpha/beta hydrolase domain-containing protein [Candidatus Binatia bacterium]|nr:alpha/beta hydrolase domain-containing protein [Candidatus Binatia bacterium]